jgi:hypothetical protein
MFQVASQSSILYIGTCHRNRDGRLRRLGTEKKPVRNWDPKRTKALTRHERMDHSINVGGEAAPIGSEKEKEERWR